MESKPPRAALLAAATVLIAAAGQARADHTVVTSSNESAGNAVLQFRQADGGALSFVARYATGGLGTDGGLGNQGAIATDGEFLFVVNAGSDDISAFRIDGEALTLTDTIASGGTRPVSVTVDRGVVYALNAGSDNIAGFRIDGDGIFTAIGGSSRPLSTTGTGPAQIGFSKDGRVLVVTEKATNSITAFPVDRFGVAGPGRTFASPGQTPFGFAVTKGRRLLVSEAAGGQPGLSSVSAWKVAPNANLSVLDAAEPTLQTAACWVAVTPDGRFAYTTNTGSGNVTGYHVNGDDLSLLDSDGVTADAGVGSAPIDMAVNARGNYLHTLNSGTDSVATFRIRNDGSLEAVGSISELPGRATGLVAY